MILLIHEFFNLRFDEADEAKVDELSNILTSNLKPISRVRVPLRR